MYPFDMERSGRATYGAKFGWAQNDMTLQKPLQMAFWTVFIYPTFYVVKHSTRYIVPHA